MNKSEHVYQEPGIFVNAVDIDVHGIHGPLWTTEEFGNHYTEKFKDLLSIFEKGDKGEFDNMLLTTEVEWHDLELDPEDLPEADEGVFVTIENQDGDRKVWGDVFYDEDSECWCTVCQNEYGQYEKTIVWYKVVGWAYNPPPMPEWR